MGKPVSAQKLLWHLTAIDNLESILRDGLLSRKRLGTANFKNIADLEIIQKRIQLGFLDYVPFHFFQGNPFDGSTIKYNPEIEFCFITVKRELAKLKRYKILTKHPLSTGSEFYDDYDEGIKNIDWELVDRRDYSEPECKIACMAECLAFGCVKPTDFFSITVRTDEIKSFVKKFSCNYCFHIDVNPYYFPVGDA